MVTTLLSCITQPTLGEANDLQASINQHCFLPETFIPQELLISIKARISLERINGNRFNIQVINYWRRHQPRHPYTPQDNFKNGTKQVDQKINPDTLTTSLLTQMCKVGHQVCPCATLIPVTSEKTTLDKGSAASSSHQQNNRASKNMFF